MDLKKTLFTAVLFWCVNVSSAFAHDEDLGFTEIFSVDEKGAQALDATDPLQDYKTKFVIPVDSEGNKLTYLNGHVIGLAPVEAQKYMKIEMSEWEHKGSSGRYRDQNPWHAFHKKFTGSFSRLLGAKPEEIVLMNTLSTNLHMAMVSFYRPTKARYKVIMEAPVYISDVFIVKSQMKFHGIDPDDALIIVEANPGQSIVMDDFKKAFDDSEGSVALVMVSHVNHLTGQLLDVNSLTKLTHANGAVLGLNLAHSVGNVPLELHEWGVDFAAWCNYKYMSGGPGSVGGLFIHKRHTENPNLHRFAGWWGSDLNSRSETSADQNFIPMASADAWQPSESPIFSMVPLQASLKIFDEVGMSAYREKSIRLTAYLEYLIDSINSDEIEIITPRQVSQRGGLLSLLIKKDTKILAEKLKERGIMCDFKNSNIIRVAAIPFYNGYHDVWKFANVLSEVYTGHSL